MENLFRKGLASTVALSASLMLATPTQAEIVLKSTDGTVSLSGELISVDDQNYNIRTPDGDLVIRREFVTCEGAECPAAEVAETEETQEVILTSDDGLVKLTGRLVEVTSTEFVIETVTGSLSVRREFASCEGPACPQGGVVSDRFKVSVPSPEGAALITRIVGDYTEAKDFNVTQQLSNDGSLPNLLVGDERGLEIARIEMENMTSVDAITALIAGESQFAFTNNRLTPQDVFAATGQNVGDIAELLNEEVIGLDAISFVVSANNRLDVINFRSIQSIINGQITNWSQLGGADQPITLHTLVSNEKLAGQLNERGITGAGVMEIGTSHASIDAMNAAIAADPTGFGILYRSQAEGLKALNLATACNIFVDNSDFAIQTEEHPLTLRWYHYTLKGGATSDLARNVGQFIPTDAGQESIASRGLVTQELQIVAMQNQGARLLTTVLSADTDRASANVMREYFNQASNASRISTSLRFQTGNATLDNKAESDIERISAIIRSNEYEGYEIIVFGFSDSYGSLAANLALAKRRGESVKEVLLADNPGYLDGDAVSSFGIGPIAPIGCNATVEGREQNRRVEVWIRPRS